MKLVSVTRLSLQILAVLVAVAMTSCSSFGPPSDFLRTPTAASKQWLDEFVHVELTKVPLGELSNRAPFRGMNIVLNGVDGDFLISFDAESITRREALWKLADHYGLTIIAAPKQAQGFTVIITNRELRRENKPLN